MVSGNAFLNDTLYVDSASGNNANTCVQARNPATPKLTITNALTCGASAVDTLVLRVLPGTYTDTYLSVTASKPSQVVSFDGNSRAILHGSGSVVQGSTRNYTVGIDDLITLRRLDIKAATDGNIGVYHYAGADYVVIDGCRIYNKDAGTRHSKGLYLYDDAAEYLLFSNNLVVEPTLYGAHSDINNLFALVNNVFIGTGAAGTKGFYMDESSFDETTIAITNNIFQNWDYGIHTLDANSNIGKVDNNLFHLVTSGREVVGEVDANKVIAGPLFVSTNLASPHAYKLLPGSPAIDAGTTAANSGTWNGVPVLDHFGSARTLGTARDIGIYEGTGFTPNPTGDFDTLTNTVAGNTVIVKNLKWKLVWDMARGGGITGFYDMTGDTTANLVAGSSLLFDVRLDANIASAAPTNILPPVFMERTRARAIVRQRLAFSASVDLNIYYSVYASGHVYIQSEIANLSVGTLDLDVVQYNLKVASASAVTQSAGSLSGISYKNGFGFLTAATKDPLLSVTRDLDGQGYFSETWSQVGSVAGAVDSIGYVTADLADLAPKMKRYHHFLLYVGDGSLDYTKAAALNADAYTPSPVSMSAGSLLHEKSWQDYLGGHWTLDEGAGTTAKDKSIAYTNNAALTSITWVAGQAAGALRFTTASVGVVADHEALEPRPFFTVAFWFKPDFTMGTTALVLSKGTTTASGWYFRKVSGSNIIRFQVDGASADSPVLTTGTWYHMTGVIGSGGVLTLYINGVPVSASSANATTIVNTDALRMGENAAGGAADRFVGDIDDVRIYHAEVPAHELQAIYRRGFSEGRGAYRLRADNNNRVVALLNETVAQTRVQPAFQIDNWYGGRTPKFVYLNGTRLVPNLDFVADSLLSGQFGYHLVLQLNKILSGQSQTLFVDDDDSSGYMGEAAKMKSLSMSSVSGDKIVIKNFADTVFGSATSGQWYTELDLNGWTTPAALNSTLGFGGINIWKAAAISPTLAISSAANLVGSGGAAGQELLDMKLDGTGGPNPIYTSGAGYTSPATLSYTILDSSATRLSLAMATATFTGDGTVTLVKKWTLYPTGRIFGSFVIASTTINLDDPRIELKPRKNTGVTSPWGTAYALAQGRWGAMGGDLEYHSTAFALLSIKNATSTYSSSLPTVASTYADLDYDVRMLHVSPTRFTAANAPVTVNFVVDISKDFTDSASAESLMVDLQTPATLTAIAGTANPADAMDFATSPDGFAEGDGAYVYTAGSGIAHFKFVNTVTHFSPAFRIKSWTFSSLPEYVTVDNQTLTGDYHYNAYVNTASNELILQFNKTFKPGTHLFYISHKTGLAVTLNHFEAISGEGVDTLRWSTESEFENLGFHVYRRVAPVQDMPDSLSAGEERVAGAGIAYALRENARNQAAAKQSRSAEGGSDTAGADRLPELSMSSEELKAQGFVRITPKLLPGAKGGSSAITQTYQYIDRAASFGTTYEYLLEAVDFNGARVQYGPRKARPTNPLETALYSNYPNPFNPITTLRFSLRDKVKVSLVIFDARGRVVRTLLRPNKPMLPGKYRLTWDARDDKGFEVPSGQYFYRFTAQKYQKTRKMILVK